MIDRIFIKNYAIIDTLELEFGRGFHAFTGETGAGKSIIVGALGLLLGEKGDSSVIRTGSDRAVIEASFTVNDAYTRERLAEMNIDASEGLIIRREVVADGGKSRAFVNGMQETLTRISEIGQWLLDIHGQHDHQLLLQQKVHIDILDSYGGLWGERKKTGVIYAELNAKLAAKAELDRLGKRFETEFYEGAGHAFLRQQTGQAGANVAATKAAWPRTLGFLRGALESKRAEADQVAATFLLAFSGSDDCLDACAVDAASASLAGDLAVAEAGL